MHLLQPHKLFIWPAVSPMLEFLWPADASFAHIR